MTLMKNFGSGHSIQDQSKVTSEETDTDLNDDNETKDNNDEIDINDALLDEIGEVLKDATKDQSSEMPTNFENGDYSNFKQKVEQIMTEYQRRNRYSTATANIKPKKQKEAGKDDSQTKFDATYDAKKLGIVVEELLTKTQISEDTKELEPDSNLTSPDRSKDAGSEQGNGEFQVQV